MSIRQIYNKIGLIGTLSYIYRAICALKTSATVGTLTVTGDSTQSAAQFSKGRVDATTAITLADTDYIIIATNAAGGTLTIPLASAEAGRTFVFMTAVATGAWTSNRAITYKSGTATTAIAAQSSLTLYSNGTNWYAIGN